MVEEVLISLSIIIAIAAILTLISRLIRQPPIIAYLIAGILVGPLFFNILGGNTSDFMQILAHIGVAFLLFIVGLNLDLRVLKEVGWSSFFVGLIQIFVTGVLGFLLAHFLGFSNIISLYIGIMLSFSSTVVVVKILSDKKEIDTLHGRISLGILIVQDIVAAIALMLIPLLSSSGHEALFFPILIKFAFAIVLIILVFLFTHFVLNKLLNYIAISHETLFLFGIAWALVLASIFFKLGFSLEIGALIAGMSIASSKYNLELGGKIKPLRDFFIVLFFVFFGSQLIGPLTSRLIITAIILSIFVIIAKPLIVMTVLKLFGYKKRINFLSGLSMAQISEFSLILVLLGMSAGHLPSEIISLVVIVALITIGTSSYNIHYSGQIFNRFAGILNMFEGKRFRNNKIFEKNSYDIILFGYHRIGYKIFNSLKSLHSSFAIVDFNPKVISSLNNKGIKAIYGDAGNKEFLNEIPLEKTKIIISTIPDLEVNLVIKQALKEARSSAVFIATTEQPSHALDLYKKGIDYVILPHHLGGEYAAKMIRECHIEKDKYKEAGKRHKKSLDYAKNNSSFN